MPPKVRAEMNDELKEVHEPMNVKEDPTNPDHYKSQTSLECIEAMEMIFGKVAVVNFCVCNAWKYIWRWKNKNGFEDLEKAKWYIDKAEQNGNYMVNSYTSIIERMRNYIDQVTENR